MNKLILILPLLLCACAGTVRQLPPEIIEKPVFIKVEVPVIKPCVTEDVPLPELMIGKLTAEDAKDPGKVVQYYVADVTLLKGVVMRQHKLLKPCLIPPDTAPTAASPTPEPAVVKPLEPAPPIEATPLPEASPTPAPAPKPGRKTFDPPPPEHS